MEKDPFKEYLKQGEPAKKRKRLRMAYSNRASGGRWLENFPIFN